MTHGSSGNGEEHGAALDGEADERGSFRALVAALERAPSRGGEGRANGNGGRRGNGGGGGGDDGGGGDNLGPLGRLLLDALQRASEMQTQFTLKATEATFKELTQAFAFALRQNTELLAEGTAALAQRVSALERELAALRPSSGGQEGEGESDGAPRTAPGESDGELR
jgi:hypothetical protein